jgi:hypothetical protein
MALGMNSTDPETNPWYFALWLAPPSGDLNRPLFGPEAGRGGAAANQGNTSTCTVDNGRTTAVTLAQMDLLGPGPFGQPTVGSIAIDPWALGLQPGGPTNTLLAPYASQITFSFSPSPNLPQGFPTTYPLGSE